jgi:hypothetical protein
MAPRHKTANPTKTTAAVRGRDPPAYAAIFGRARGAIE